MGQLSSSSSALLFFCSSSSPLFLLLISLSQAPQPPLSLPLFPSHFVSLFSLSCEGKVNGSQAEQQRWRHLLLIFLLLLLLLLLFLSSSTMVEVQTMKRREEKVPAEVPGSEEPSLLSLEGELAGNTQVMKMRRATLMKMMMKMMLFVFQFIFPLLFCLISTLPHFLLSGAREQFHLEPKTTN